MKLLSHESSANIPTPEVDGFEAHVVKLGLCFERRQEVYVFGFLSRR